MPDAMRLCTEAGWNQRAADWRRFLEAGPAGCFAAELDGAVAGTATTIVYENRFAWIGMVLVDARLRGAGIGTALLRHSIQYLESLRIPTIKLDATPQGKPLYEAAGFVVEYDVERWSLTRAASRAPVPGASPRIEDALRRDRDVFGADRGFVLRSLAAEAPELTLEARSAGRLAGYAFGRHGSRADHLGPWMAEEKGASEDLLDEFLHRSGRETLFVDCCRRNPWAAELLALRGFQYVRPLTRMFRGTNEHPGRPDLVCAIAGPEFG